MESAEEFIAAHLKDDDRARRGSASISRGNGTAMRTCDGLKAIVLLCAQIPLAGGRSIFADDEEFRGRVRILNARVISSMFRSRLVCPH